MAKSKRFADAFSMAPNREAWRDAEVQFVQWAAEKRRVTSLHVV